MTDDTCKHCGGDKAIRNPRGDCDHLFWPDLLTDEAKLANGYRRIRIVDTKWIAPTPSIPTSEGEGK